jgi:hypothetical protein
MNKIWARKQLRLRPYYTCHEVHYSWREKMKKLHPDKKKAVQLNKAKSILLQECHQPESDFNDPKHKIFYPFESFVEELRFWNSVIKGDIDNFFS